MSNDSLAALFDSCTPPVSLDDPLARFDLLDSMRSRIPGLMLKAARDWLQRNAPKLRRVNFDLSFESGDDGSYFRSLQTLDVIDDTGCTWSLPTCGEGFDESELPEHVPDEADDWPRTHLAPALGIDPDRIDDFANLLQTCAHLDYSLDWHISMVDESANTTA